jgi:hypothetical protein
MPHHVIADIAGVNYWNGSQHVETGARCDHVTGEDIEQHANQWKHPLE